MSRGCLPEVGAGTQSYFSLSEWEYIYCAIICWKSLICFLIFTRCDSLRDCLECQKGHWTFALFRLLQIVRIIEVRLNAFSFFFFIFFLYSYLLQNILTAVSPSCTAFCPPTPDLPSSRSTATIFLQKRAGLPGLSAKHIIPRCSNTGNKLLYQGCRRQYNRRKNVPKGGIRVTDNMTLTIRTTTNTIN